MRLGISVGFLVIIPGEFAESRSDSATKDHCRLVRRQANKLNQSATSKEKKMSTAYETLFDEYQRDGYAVVEDMFSPDELGELRERITAVAEGRVPGFPEKDIEYEPGERGSRGVLAIRKINRCAENDAVFLKHAGKPGILDVVETLIGPDIKLFASQCFMKPPGGIEKPYHQDSAYFTIEPLSLVTCWIALDDVTIENGCMWVIPASHRGELFDHNQEWDVGGRKDMQVPDKHLDLSREVPIKLRAGSCSFHHSVLLHRSGRNQTNSSRRGLAIHYMSSHSRWTHPTLPKPMYPLLRGQEFADCV
jgi:ectoine hydroxylase-related dioxygenase (phytanoyl-CoA dioxygenase family)